MTGANLIAWDNRNLLQTDQCASERRTRYVDGNTSQKKRTENWCWRQKASSFKSHANLTEALKHNYCPRTHSKTTSGSNLMWQNWHQASVKYYCMCFFHPNTHTCTHTHTQPGSLSRRANIILEGQKFMRMGENPRLVCYFLNNQIDIRLR